MGEDGQVGAQTHGRLWRRVAVALTAGILLLLIFHRPLLLGLGRQIALHYAAREHLKIDFRLEGNVFTNLTVRNLHAVPTGPSDVESIDVDLAHADYGLFAPLRHGLTSIKNLDVRSVRIVLNPAKAPLRPRPPDPKKKITLPNPRFRNGMVSNQTASPAVHASAGSPISRNGNAIWSGWSGNSEPRCCWARRTMDGWSR